MQLEYRGTTYRHPLWCKEAFLRDIKQCRNVKKVCSFYADERTGWRGYYADYWRWKKQDPVFEKEVIQYIVTTGSGRKRLDNGDKGWQIGYCKELDATNGNYGKAAAVTPYSVREIYEFLSPMSSQYDDTFAKMVDEVFLRKAGDIQEKFLGLMGDENYKDIDTSKITQQKSWVYLRGLEKMDPGRWGRKSETKVTGEIRHLHLQDRAMSPEDRLARLWEEQQRFFESRRQEIAAVPQLPAPREREEIVVAEVVEEKVDA